MGSPPPMSWLCWQLGLAIAKAIASWDHRHHGVAEVGFCRSLHNILIIDAEC